MVPPYSHRVSRVRRYSGYSWLSSAFVYVAITLYGYPSHDILLAWLNTVRCPNPKGITTSGLASSAFARHYLRFQFRRFPTTCYFIHKRLTEYCSAGFPHSEIHGSRTAFVSPWLIVDRYVLLRLPMPRHSPCALISLTFFRIMCPFGFVNFTQLKIVVFLPNFC